MPATNAPRRLPAEVRREQILDAAQHVLLERGLRDTTMADVAAAAGVAKGTTYVHFESKDDVLAALRARYLVRLGAASSTPSAGNVHGQLRAMVVGLFRFSAANRRLHHLLFHEAGFSEADAYADLRDRVAVLITAGVDSGEWRAADVALTTTFVVHGIHGALVHSLHAGRDGRVPRVAGAVVELVERMLTPS